LSLTANGREWAPIKKGYTTAFWHLEIGHETVIMVDHGVRTPIAILWLSIRVHLRFPSFLLDTAQAGLQ